MQASLIQFNPFPGQSLVGREGVIIDCRTEHDSYFPDPDNCHMFYHCSDWTGLEHKSCGTLFFHPQKRVCDWPYIVRRVRNDCPADQEIPELIVEDAATTEEAAFDDGSVFKFEPEPQNRFRFPTQPPKPKPLVFLESPKDKSAVKVSTLSRNAGENPAIPFVEATKPFVLVRDSVKEEPRPTRLRVIERQPVVKSLSQDAPERAKTVIKTRPVANSNRARQRQRQPVIKTLPQRNIVKSLPAVTPVTVTEAPRSGNPNTRRRQPAKVQVKAPIKADADPVLICDNGRCFDPSDPEERPKIKIVKPAGDDIEAIFHKVNSERIALEKAKQALNIQSLLEQAKVTTLPPPSTTEDTTEDELTTTALPEEFDTTTVAFEDYPAEETTETLPEEERRGISTQHPVKVVIKTTETPFKTVEERPSFLEVVKQRAEEFKEQLMESDDDDEIDEGQESVTEGLETLNEDDEDEVERLVVTLVKVTTTSATATDDEDVTEAVPTTTVAAVKDLDVPDEQPPALTTTEASIVDPEEVSDEIATTTQETPVPGTISTEVPSTTPKTAETTTSSTTSEETTTTSSTPTTTASSAEDDQDFSTKISVVVGSSTSVVAGNTFEEEDEETGEKVFVVQAVAAPVVNDVPDPQPLVDINSIDEDESPVQESRVHATIAVKEEEETPEEDNNASEEETNLEGGNEKKEEVKEHSSFDMIMKVIDHLNLHALMHHISDNEVEVDEAATEPSTTPATTTTTTSTEAEVGDKISTTEASTASEDTTQVASASTTTEAVPTTTTDQSEVRTKISPVQVVLPSGWTTEMPTTTEEGAAETTTIASATTTSRASPDESAAVSTTTVATTTDTVTTTTTSRTKPRIIIKPVSPVQEDEDDDIKPAFVPSKRTRIRQRLRSGLSGVNVLKLINQKGPKTLAELRAEVKQDSVSVPPPAVLLIKKPTKEDVSKLVDRRKQLFSARRTTTKRPSTPKARTTSSPSSSVEQVKKNKILEEMKKKKLAAAAASIRERPRSSSPLLRSSSSSTSTSPSSLPSSPLIKRLRLPQIRRPKLSEPSPSSIERGNVGGQRSEVGKTEEERRRSLRCRLFRKARDC